MTTCANTTIPGFYTSEFVHPECQPFALRAGHQDALILLHGLTGTPNDFQDYAQHFADHFDVYVPLLPGHGSHICHLQHLTLKELMIPLPALTAFLRKNYRQVHLTGMSYGAVMALALALDEPLTSLGLIAPAMQLVTKAERKIALIQRTGLDKFIPRLSKKKAYRKEDFKLSNPHTYQFVALGPTKALHQLAQNILPRLPGLDTPVWHAHGDADDTTPLEANYGILREALPQYEFLRIPQGRHIPTLGATARQLAQDQLAWLQRHSLD